GALAARPGAAAPRRGEHRDLDAGPPALAGGLTAAMEITDPLILPADTVLEPVAGLPASVRSRLEAQEGEYALSRPRLRSSSRILDAGSAALVTEFRTARTIVEAVL